MLRTLFLALFLALSSTGFADQDTSILIEAQQIAQSGQESMTQSIEFSRQGDMQSAQQLYEETQQKFLHVKALCSSVDPEGFDTAETAMLYATTMEMSQQHDFAARGFERAYRLSSADLEAGLSAAIHWRKVGLLMRAFHLLEEIRETENLDPEFSSRLHTELGRVHHEQGLYSLAAKMYEVSTESGHPTPEATIGSAVLAVRRGELEVAADILDTLRELNVDQGQFLNKSLAESLTTFDDLRIPVNGQHRAYARLLVRSQRNHDAMLAAEHAVMRDDSDFSMFNLLGGLLAQQQHYDRSIRAYETSLALKPDQERTKTVLEQVRALQQESTPQ
jgi:tetratricopeptide (TPR) repeat protein